MRSFTILAIVFACAVPAFTQDSRPGRREKRDRFDEQGIQVGQSLPADAVKVIRLDGKDGNLAKAWRDRPALIVTASLTCPVARRQFDAVRQIAEDYRGRIWVVIVYTVEAHPAGSASPYRGREWITPQNEREGILRAQPATIDERLTLAREFRDSLDVNVAVAVDTMDNALWKRFGGGPNMGLLIDVGGKVVAKHGWFHHPTMTQSIDALLASKTPATQPAP